MDGHRRRAEIRICSAGILVIVVIKKVGRAIDQITVFAVDGSEGGGHDVHPSAPATFSKWLIPMRWMPPREIRFAWRALWAERPLAPFSSFEFRGTSTRSAGSSAFDIISQRTPLYD